MNTFIIHTRSTAKRFVYTVLASSMDEAMQKVYDAMMFDEQIDTTYDRFLLEDQPNQLNWECIGDV